MIKSFFATWLTEILVAIALTGFALAGVFYLQLQHTQKKLDNATIEQREAKGAAEDCTNGVTALDEKEKQASKTAQVERSNIVPYLTSKHTSAANLAHLKPPVVMPDYEATIDLVNSAIQGGGV